MMNLREVEAEMVEGDPLVEEEEKGGQVEAEDRVVEEAKGVAGVRVVEDKDLAEVKVGKGVEKVAEDHMVENLVDEEKEAEVED